MPVRQLGRDSDSDAGGFEVDQEVFRPVLDAGVLVEDVAHFYRGLSPFNKECTVTICNGIFARRTLAAVRALTDADFRDRNEEYLDGRFPSREQFSILFRVPVINGAPLTPDWTTAASLLHEWPPRED